MNESQNLKQTFLSLILFFYVLLPLAFYGIPLSYVLIEQVDFNVHWYVDFALNSESLFRILAIHLFIGLSIYLVSKHILQDLKIKQSKNSFVPIFIILCLTVQFFPISYIKLLSFLALIFLLTITQINTKILLIFFIFSFLSLVLSQDRELFVFFSILLALSLRMSLLNIFVFGILGLMFLSLVLEPLKYGMSPIEFFSTNEGLFYLLVHLQPIYVSGFFFLEYDQNLLNLFAEGIPFMKGFLDVGSVSISENFSKYDAGISLDFGSNSSMYASLQGVFVCLLFLSILTIMPRLSEEYSASFIFYITLMGPTFIRRSFGSYVVDLIILFVFICLIFGTKILAKRLFRPKKNSL